MPTRIELAGSDIPLTSPTDEFWTLFWAPTFVLLVVASGVAARPAQQPAALQNFRAMSSASSVGMFAPP